MSRVGTKGILPRWCRREHATTGADQTPGLCPVTPSSEGRPLLAVSGSSWGPVEVSSHALWTVGGCLPLRGHKGPGPVRASVLLSQVLARSRGHTCRTLRGTGSVSSTILTIRKVPERHVAAYPVQQRLRYVRGWPLLTHWGPPCSDDPVGSSGLEPGPWSMAARIRTRTPPG